MQFTTSVTLIGKDQVIIGRDSGGRPIYGDDTTPSPGWVLWPASSTEETSQSEDITTTKLVGWAPAGTDLTRYTQVRVPGLSKPYNVNGDAWPWKSPFTGKEPGVQVSLEVVV